LSESSWVSDAGAAPVVVIQTSPDDLLTDQTPSSAANALELPIRTIASASAQRIPVRETMNVPRLAHP
jgi:hypothetical protein